MLYSPLLLLTPLKSVLESRLVTTYALHCLRPVPRSPVTLATYFSDCGLTKTD